MTKPRMSKPAAESQSSISDRDVGDGKTNFSGAIKVSRRDALVGSVKGMAAVAMSRLPTISLGTAAVASASQAAVGKIPFGVAVNPYRLRDDERYGPAIIKYCDLIVPSTGMKWKDIQNTRGVFDFRIADELFAFARDNKLPVRGHTLVWDDCRKMPKWTKDEIKGATEAERELVGYIIQVMTRYKDYVRSWDVVNEPLRMPCDHDKTIWERRLGRNYYIELAFRTAHAIDPTAQLVLNENEIELNTGPHREKRKKLLDLILELLDNGIPIKAVGIQAHISGHLPIDVDGLAEFSERVRKEQLKILITELDVNDHAVPGDFKARDKVVAQKTSELLNAVAKPDAILTWGITDKHTWLQRKEQQKKKQGKPFRSLRPLPLDEDYVEKAMMRIIQDFR